MPKIPPILKPATNYDFRDPRNKIIVGMKFWIHGYHPEVYVKSGKYASEEDVPLEEHITTENLDLESLQPWMEDRRIYVESQLFKAQTTFDYI